MANEPEANFLKIILLLMKYGSKVLQHRIEFEVWDRDQQRVTEFLDERKHDILHLTLGKGTRCCIKDCEMKKETKCWIHKSLLELMYEDVKKSCSTKFIQCCSCNFVPKSDLDISVWDISLTSCLLLDVIGFSDRGQKQAIQNLRNLRNSKDLLHRGNAEMEADKFENMWLRLSNDIKEVAEKCEPYFFDSICKEVDNLKRNPLEDGECYKAQECWRRLKNEEDCIHSVVNLLTSLNSELKRDIEVENIYDYSKSCLKDHQEKIGTYVGPKRAITYSLKAMENQRFIVITGEAGSGKTRFGLELMSQMQKKYQNLTALVLTECSQWNKLDFKKEYILFIDDLLGKSNASDIAFQGWSMTFDSMHKKLMNNHVVIIFALRNCIWHLMKDRLADYILFRLLKSSNPPVNLSGEFGLTSQEKFKLLNRYRRSNNVDICSGFHRKKMSFECPSIGPLCVCQETLKIIADMDTIDGFPFLCEKFFSDHQSLKQGSSFFHISARIFMKGQIDELLCKEKYLHYAVLVFLFLKDDLLKKDEISKFKKEIVNVAEQIGDIKPKKIINATVISCLNDMLHIFISSSDKGYRLRHMVINEAVLMSFGENFSEEFLKLIPKTVLFTYVRSSGYVAGDQEVIVQLDDDMTELLAKRLIDIYGSNKEEAYSEVYKHPSFQDRKLVDCFLDILESEESFKVFLKSFLAGACKERKDILASEVIRRFVRSVSSDEFESDILELMLSNDLIHTFRQYMNESAFEKLFSKLNIERFGVQFLKNTIIYGARQCLLDILSYLDTENDLETDCDKDNKTCILTEIYDDRSFLFEMLIYHDPLHGNDWTDVLTKLAELCPSLEKRNEFYTHALHDSFVFRRFDIAFLSLERIHTIKEHEVYRLLEKILCSREKDFFHSLIKKLKRDHFRFDSLKSTRLISNCIRNYNSNEDMFIHFLNEIPIHFDYNTNLGTTILHVCEKRNFSDSTLLRLLQRPEGKFMFTFVDEEGRTSVQCRATYQKVRKQVTSQGSTDCLRVHDIDWRDDTLVVNSSFQDLHVHDVVWRDDALVSHTTFKDCPMQDVVLERNYRYQYSSMVIRRIRRSFFHNKYLFLK